MTLAKEPKTHDDLYDPFLKALYKKSPELKSRFGKPCKIEYGHEPPKGTLRDDQKLLAAQNQIEEKISHKSLKQTMPQQFSVVPFYVEVIGNLLRKPISFVRDDVFTHGFTDAIYYASTDGERAVRNSIYTKVLGELEEAKKDNDVRLHVVAHSLGATVMFDFLYGLFAPDENYPEDKDNEKLNHKPDFFRENINDEKMGHYAECYDYWRQRSTCPNKKGTLKLASFSTFGGQLPFFLMRKQKLVDMLHNKESLDVSVIGVEPNNSAMWKVFYDVNDILGYPVKGLFGNPVAIQEFHIGTTWNIFKAHDWYWKHPKVISEIGKLLRDASR